MADKKKVHATPDKELDFIKYFIVVLFAYIIGENLTILVTSLVPGILVPLTNLLGTLASPLIAVIIILILVRFISFAIPELNTTAMVPWYIFSIPMIILSHPLIAAISGSNFIVKWVLLDIIEFGSPLLAIFEIILFLFAGYVIALILATNDIRTHTKINRYLKYLADEIITIAIVFFVVIYLLVSFIIENFESLDLTEPIKISLFYLYYMATYPENEST